MKYLVRDCLDNRLLDVNGEPCGHIDGIVLSVPEGAQPRVVAIEVGSVVQARRIGPRYDRFVRRLTKRWGRMRPNPFRIPWRALTPGAHDFRVDLKAEDTPLRAWERWLRERVVRRVPGA